MPLGFSPWVGKIPLEVEMATHSSIVAWKIPWTEEPGRLQSLGSQRVNLGTSWKPTIKKSNMHPSLITWDGPLLLGLPPASSGQQPLIGAPRILPFSPLWSFPTMLPAYESRPNTSDGSWLPCYKMLRTDSLCFSHVVGLCSFLYHPLHQHEPVYILMQTSRWAGSSPSQGSQGGSLLKYAAISRMDVEHVER